MRKRFSRKVEVRLDGVPAAVPVHVVWDDGACPAQIGAAILRELRERGWSEHWFAGIHREAELGEIVISGQAAPAPKRG